MNAFEFIKKIDNIYEKVYNINESLSLLESKEFMRGFNDGIKEGWFSKAAGAAGKFVGKTFQGAKDAYNKGKDMANKAWSTVKEFADSIYSKIKTGLSTAADWISSQPAKIKDYLGGIYNGVIKDLSIAYDKLKNKGVELQQAISSIMSNIKTTIVSSCQKIKTQWETNKEKAQQWYITNKAIVIEQAKEAKASTAAWLRQAGIDTLNLLAKIANGTVQVGKVIGVISLFLIFAPFVALVKGAVSLHKVAHKFVSDGIDAIGEEWKKGIGEFKTQFAEQQKPLGEQFKHIKTFESFNK